MAWYYVEKTEQLGPIEDDAFENLVQTGKITPATLVWRNGLPEWLPYGQIPTSPASPNSTPQPTTSHPGDTVICSVSGKSVPKSEAIQISGQWVSREHKNEFLQKLKEGVELPGQLIYAGFWIRFAAKFIDGLILGAVGWAIQAGLSATVFSTVVAQVNAHPVTPGDTFAQLRIEVPLLAVLTIINLLITLGYETYFLGRFGATWGEMACGLRVVRPDASPITYGRAAGRSLAEILSGLPTLYIGYLLVAFDSQKRALHDRIAGTRVVKR